MGHNVRIALGLACALTALACGDAMAATAPIYKCLDRNAGLVYTDAPCKDGERLDIQAGQADPAAIARLEREREAWERTGAQRLADEQRIRLQSRYAMVPAYGGYGFADGAGDGLELTWPAYGYYGNGYPGAYPYERRRAQDARHDRRFERTRVVPAHPQIPRPR